MNCNLAQCEYFFNEICVCPDDEQKNIVHNNTKCPSFYDIEENSRKARENLIRYLHNVIDELGLENSKYLKNGLLTQTNEQLLKSADQIDQLYQSNMCNKNLDLLLLEIKEIGVDAFREKYQLA
ncbi:MAG TPA: hypothetical protein VJ824_13005 [Bacillota bacterium]|nr:hypothetical protein [Bacillota bacterium]